VASGRRTFLPGFVGKRRQGHQLILTDQAGARESSEREAQALAEADSRSGRTRGSQQQLDEIPRVLDARRRCTRRLQCVERVSLDERAMKRCERLDLADVVEHDESTADRDEHSHLAAVDLDGLSDSVQLLAAALEYVVHRAGV
jgi:hypothetical protein